MPRLWANLILKFNRSQLQKRKVRTLKDMLDASFKEEGLEFKKVSAKELESIKQKIRIQARQDAKKAVMISILSCILALILLWVLSYWIIALVKT